MSESNYKDNALNGPYVSYHTNGSICTECTRDKHGLQGEYRQYNPSTDPAKEPRGTLREYANYKNNRHHGICITYDNGWKIAEYNYENGDELSYILYDINGNIRKSWQKSQDNNQLLS